MKQLHSTTSAFRSILLNHGTPLSLEMGRVIFKQGERGNNFFFIVEGHVEIRFDGRTRKILRSGDFFGELGALSGLPRTATATCLSACQLIEISSDEIDRLVSRDRIIEKKILAKYGTRLLHSRMRSYLQNSPMSDASYSEILSNFERISIEKKNYLFSEEDPSDQLYLILRGSLMVIQSGDIIANLKAGDFVGEIGILKGIPRTADVFALNSAELYACSANKVRALLPKFPQFDRYLTDIADRRLSRAKRR